MVREVVAGSALGHETVSRVRHHGRVTSTQVTRDPDALPTVAPVDDVLADLEWRGLLAQTTDREGLASVLRAGPVTLYCGFDPTAESLHVGNLVPLFALRRFQLAGHRPVALVGGATGFIGDPGGRTTERQLQSAEQIQQRVALISNQFRRLLDVDGGGALLVDNMEWTRGLTVIDFLRDVGKHFPVNQMLARDSVSARLLSGGLSFTEFSYQLLQSLDFLELNRRYGCLLQVGATDQWGNITAGLDYMRRVDGVSGHALTFPLITDSQGHKLGKSTGGGAVWLDPALTSPYALFQFALNVPDADVVTYLKLLTFVDRDTVEELASATEQRAHDRAAHKRLARELVALVHGSEQVVRVEAAAEALFGGGDLRSLDLETLTAALADAPSVRVDHSTSVSVVDLMAEGLGISRSEVRRAVRDGGVYVNNVRVVDGAAVLAEGDWLLGRFVLLRKGRRHSLVVERGERDC